MAPLLVRKIDRLNWEEHRVNHFSETPGAAITCCIGAKDNTLSFWQIDTINKLQEAALAITGSHKYYETFDAVAIDATSLADQGIKCISTEGDTRVNDLKNTHVEMVDITYDKLGVVASLIYASLRQDMVDRFDIDQQIVLLDTAVKAERLNSDDLPRKMRNKLSNLP